MALGDMEHDRPCLEQGEVAFLIGRNLAERMKCQMRGFLHRAKRNKANLVGLTHFLKRPANARITRQSFAAIGRPFKSGDGGGHWNAPGDWIAIVRHRGGRLSALSEGLRLTGRPGCASQSADAGAEALTAVNGQRPDPRLAFRGAYPAPRRSSRRCSGLPAG